jgi:EAL domain-containing protein (putative c-di-GMP-specific phosphodiesterase class I)/CheY-like chemotaxis protein
MGPAPSSIPAVTAGVVRVLFVDDRPRAAQTARRFLEQAGDFEVVGAAGSVAEAGRLAASVGAHVALVDVRVPDGGGQAAARAIAAASPETRILAHSAAADAESVVEMLRAGASGYIGKGASLDTLAEALRAAAEGSSNLEDRVADELLRDSAAAPGGGAERTALQRAIAGEGLRIAYQPIFDLEARAVIGHEALTRFQEPGGRGTLEWFEEARQAGLGAALELTAVRAALLGAGRLPPGTFLAVNVSPCVAESPSLAALVEEGPVEHLVLEVSEHARLADYARFRRAVAGMRRHGTRLAVDDAGAGPSTLRHVIEVEAELIKLDASLTRYLEEDPRRRSLASALIEFGRATGADVVAEGIESELQLSELRRLGVRYGQGFHLGRPAPAPGPA